MHYVHEKTQSLQKSLIIHYIIKNHSLHINSIDVKLV